MKNFNFLLLIFTFSFLVFSSSACAPRKIATSITADVASRGMFAVESESDTFVARETVLPLIKMLEVLQQGDPNNKKFNGILAKAYGNYAFGFGEIEMMRTLADGNPGHSISEWPNRVKGFYLKGKQSGVKALANGKKDIETVSMPDFPKYLKKFGKKDIDTLFWTAFNWGSYINMNRGDIVEVANLPRVEAMVDRVIEIDPNFNCGVAYAFKGVIIVGNPLRNGGKPETAKPYFEKAIASCDSKYLMNKVMYAEWYGGNTNEKGLFKTELNEVISSDTTGALPKYALANELAKERAKLLLRSSK